MKPVLLIIDDEGTLLDVLQRRFESRYDVQVAESGAKGLALLQNTMPAVILLDLRMPDMDGIEVLKRIKEQDPAIPVVLFSAYAEVDIAVQAMKLGADHFLSKPVQLQALEVIFERAIQNADLHKKYERLQKKFADLSERLILDRKTMEAISVMAASPDTTVLITGPTGVGKSVVAELIHRQSARHEGPFIEINCAGLSEELLDSELFGHERGAFTDAKTTKYGLMELANRGTLFLDEIGEMPLAIQAKVLTAFETKRFRRLGGTKNLDVDTRIIAATNSDLQARLRAGKFREDLYYRLNVLPIALRPLSERRDDIPKLAYLFLQEFATKMNKPVAGFADDALARLVDYSWPGNIREIKNVVERACILCDGALINVHHLPGFVNHAPEPVRGGHDMHPMTIEEAERGLIARTLAHTHQNKAAAARILGINISTLSRKMRRYQVEKA